MNWQTILSQKFCDALTVEQYICKENMKIAVMHMIHIIPVI